MRGAEWHDNLALNPAVKCRDSDSPSLYFPLFCPTNFASCENGMTSVGETSRCGQDVIASSGKQSRRAGCNGRTAPASTQIVALQLDELDDLKLIHSSLLPERYVCKTALRIDEIDTLRSQRQGVRVEPVLRRMDKT
jgi:hypothetical protein